MPKLYLPEGLSFLKRFYLRILGASFPVSGWSNFNYFRLLAVLTVGFVLCSIVIQPAHAQAPALQSMAPIKFTYNTPSTPVAVLNRGGSVPAVIYGSSILKTRVLQNSGERAGALPDNSGNFFFPNVTGIFKMNLDNISLYAGNEYTQGYKDAEGPLAMFSVIKDMVKDQSGIIYVLDNNLAGGTRAKIRKIDLAGYVTTVSNLHFDAYRMAIGNKNELYVSTFYQIYRISSTGAQTLVAGKDFAGGADGPALNASFNIISGMVFDADGNMYVSESVGGRIRKITPDGIVSTLTTVENVGDIVLDPENNMFVRGTEARLFKISPAGIKTAVPTGLDGRLISASSTEVFAVSQGGVAGIQLMGYQITPALPAGLVLGTDGTITGTPTQLSSAKNYTITARNSAGESSIILSIEVAIKTEPPVITQFSPKAAQPGNVLTLTGSNFLGLSGVSIGGIASATPTIVSDTQLTAIVMEGAASGDVVVSNPYGQSIASGFEIIKTPVITSFTPTSAPRGGTVMISGENFTGITNVVAGDYGGGTFRVISPTLIEFTVSSNGNSGTVRVYNPAGQATLPGFTVIAQPTINTYNYIYGATGQEITISGTDFTNASEVTLGGVDAASFTVINATTIKAIVGSNPSGLVAVRTPGGLGVSSIGIFVFLPPPLITSATPLESTTGRQVQLLGANLREIKSVKFGGVNGTWSNVAGTSLIGLVGEGATGDIEVTTSAGTSTFPGFVFNAPPTISTFSPAIASAGDTVEIIGTNFTSSTVVLFGYTPATSVNVVSSTKLQVLVGLGSSPTVIVQTQWGQATATGFTHRAPVIASFTPAHALAGQTVSIIGSGFTGATAVTFGEVDAASFNIISPTEITAVVGSGSSGAVAVQTPAGKGYRGGFSNPAPYITDAPFSGYAGQTLRIDGGNFVGTSSVRFGGVEATSFRVVSATRIEAVVSAGGDIIVTSPAGTGKRTGFTIYAAPTITSFTPASQATARGVTILGTNFTGVNAVKFGNALVYSTTIISPTELYVVLKEPLSGDVSVSNGAGTATLGGFTSLSPVIDSFTPSTAGASQTVTIAGTNIDETSDVYFNNIKATSFSQLSATSVSAVVPPGGAGGTITLVTAHGTANKSGFNLIPVPTITSFSPVQGGAGTDITILGLNLNNLSTATFGGTAAVSFVVNNSTSVTAKVGSGTSGSIAVSTPGGTVAKEGFTWIPQPAISSIFPLSAANGDTITVTGTDLATTSAVKLSSKAMVPFAITATSLKFVLTDGEPGNITITAIGGTASFDSFTFIQPPSISSYTSSGDGAGATVTINGFNFDGTTSVSFGGISATSFTVASSTVINAQVGQAKTGAIQVKTPGGVATYHSFIFQNPPQASSFSPTSGPAGTSITITGSNFNTSAQLNQVFFGTVKGHVTAATSTMLTVTVPANAQDEKITVVNTANKLSAVFDRSFRVIQPSDTPGVFSYMMEIPLSYNAKQITPADMDGDGKIDLVVITDPDQKPQKVIVYKNGFTGSFQNSFQPVYEITLTDIAQAITIDDITGDGKPDIIYEGTGKAFLALTNTSVGGNISFETLIVNEHRPPPGEKMIIRDMDLDGKADLIMTEGSDLRIFRNTSFDTDNVTVSFSPALELLPWNTSRDFRIADIDGDGKPDVLYPNNGSRLKMSRNRAVPGSLTTSSFEDAGERTKSDGNSTGLTIADLDGDGNPDLIESDILYLGSVGMHRNTSTLNSTMSQSFAAPQAFSHGVSGVIYFTPTVKDVNSDGKPDMLFANGSQIRRLNNNSTLGSLQWSSDVLFDYKSDLARTISPDVADLDGDGTPEIIFATTGYNDRKRLMILHNIPTAPAISSVYPAKGGPGDTITIRGANFLGATSVKFGGTEAASFSIVSSSILKAVVGAGAAGDVSVQTSMGTGVSSDFIFEAASLSLLELEQGVLIPQFSPQQLNYTTNIDSRSSGLMMGVVASSSNAKLKINGVETAPGSVYSHLTAESNLITIEVTSADMTVKKTYTLTFNRIPPPVLSSVELNGASLIPAFSPNVVDYTAQVSSGVSTITVSPVVAGSSSTIYVNGIAVASGTASQPVNLSVGVNNLTIVLTATDPPITQTYSIKVTRPSPENVVASLLSLQLAQAILSPAFSSEILSYTANVDHSVSTITLTPTVTSATSTVKVNGTPATSGVALAAIPLAIGPNMITVVVLGNDGVTAKTYTILINRGQANQVLPDSKGAVTVSQTSSQVFVTTAAIPIALTVPAGVINASLDYSALISGGTGILPQTIVSSSVTTMAIPPGTRVTSSNTSWNGILNVPHPTSYQIADSPGEITSYGLGIEVGSPDVSLLFDRAIRLVLPGEAGKRAGFVRQGIFTEITTTGSTDSQAEGDGLPPGGAYKFNLGADLVIWTRGFSKFITFTRSIDPDIALLALDFASITESAIKGSNPSLSQVSTSLTNPLPSIGNNGSTISWASSNPSVLTSDGKTVVRPVSGTITVKLTATIKKGNIAETKEFTITILANEALQVIPVKNFTLQTISESCRSSNNGSIIISAERELNYTAKITGGSFSADKTFSKTLSLSDLQAGTYSICITVAGWEAYQQCFTAVITEPQDLAAIMTVKSTERLMSIDLQGGEKYQIDVNGKIYSTSQDQIDIPLEEGDNRIRVTTDKECQGMVDRLITIERATPFPNPFDDTMNIDLGGKLVAETVIKLSDSSGRVVFSQRYPNQSGLLQIKLPQLSSGLYMMTVSKDRVQHIYKVIKK